MDEEDGLEPFPTWEGNDFGVVLQEVGRDRIGVIKVLRASTALSLTTIRRLLERAPKTVIEGASRQEAERIKKSLVAVGATAEVMKLGGIPPE